ncbi:MAG: hypothetical protein NZU63_13010, partial [Gemmataceae bacterium]|nr:hypothetical protein [Gemmataceae bacterium]
LHQPTNRRFAIIVTCWFGQFLLSAYIAFFLALILIVFTILTLIRQYRILPWRDLLVANWRVWVGRVLIVLAILPPLGGILVRHALVAGSTPTEYILLWSPVAHSWLIPPPHSVTATFYQIVGLSLQDEEGECRLFAGLIPYIAMIFALLAIAWTNPTPEGQRRLAVGLLGAAGLLLALVITRWGNFWLYEPLLDVPGFRQIRAVGRLILVLLFPLGLAVGECLTALGHRWLHKGATLATVALLIIMIAEHLLLPTTWEQHWDRHRHSLAQQVRWQDRLANIIRRHPRPQVVYVFPSELLQAPKYEQQLYRLQVLAMRSAQNVGLPCINGYSGYMPIEWDIFFGYRSLFEWLTGTYPLPQHQFRGLVLIGEPEPDVDPEYEGIMRQLYPPLPLPPWD